jgi:trk system potassium uptake protein TrkA
MSGSILAAMYLKEMKVERIIVKAISDDHKKILDKIGVTEVIFPEREMAVKLARNITTPNLLDYLPLSEDFSIMEIIPPEEFIGESLSELDLRKKYEIQVIGINDTHADKVELLVSPGHVIKQTDRLLILGTQKSLNKIKQLKGFQ